MTNISEMAASADVNWRTLLRLTPGITDAVADAVSTRRGHRTATQNGIIEVAKQISDGDPDKEQREKIRRRMMGVNSVQDGTRVNGRTLNGVGQPRTRRGR